MSDIIKTVTATVTRDKVVGKKCDICGQETDGLEDRTWHSFIAYYKETELAYDVCSGDCFKEALCDALDKLEGGTISGMPWQFVNNLIECFKEND